MGGVQHSTVLLAKSLNKIGIVDIKILIPEIGMMSRACDMFSITYDYFEISAALSVFSQDKSISDLPK